jgi:hypothetical protein
LKGFSDEPELKVGRKKKIGGSVARPKKKLPWLRLSNRCFESLREHPGAGGTQAHNLLKWKHHSEKRMFLMTMSLIVGVPSTAEAMKYLQG